LWTKQIPEVEQQERQVLKKMAAEHGWDFGDYDVERQILDEKFGRWIPTLASYAVVILLYSVVETQLNALAERVGVMHNSRFRLKDVAGRGIERAALYLKRAAALEIKDDSAWPHLLNLQALRNVIAHSGGRVVGLDGNQKRSLTAAYPGDLHFQEHGETRQEIRISMILCRTLAQHTEEFFERIFKAAGLQEKGVQFVP
jgi:hypothetical protein